MERIVIFGASLGGVRGLRALPRRRKAIAFSDNNCAKQGTRFHGLPVVAPVDLGRLRYDRVLIASSYYQEIYHQLLDLGIAADRIDILDLDVLNGHDEPTGRVYWLFGAVGVVLALALYGAMRLFCG